MTRPEKFSEISLGPPRLLAICYRVTHFTPSRLRGKLAEIITEENSEALCPVTRLQQLSDEMPPTIFQSPISMPVAWWKRRRASSIGGNG